MNPAKWQNIKNIFSAVVDLPEQSRLDFLAGEDEEISREVRKLLLAHEKADNFIDKPILVEGKFIEDANEDHFIGRQIENYLILEKIGVGGMGAVYLAERLNSDFKQKIALKIIKRGMDSEAILKSFATERRILSTLKHPNIAQLLDGGISKEGLPFFVMEYVDGKPLTQFCREHAYSLHERLELFQKICSAVEHAHKNLIVHRDLKPSNILVTDDGTLKLLDFGIAKVLSDEDTTETTATQIKLLTPEYASPEQFLGKTVTTATDIYSLGVILYELLTGHRPYETKGRSYEEIIKSVCETSPRAPSYSWQETATQEREDTKRNSSETAEIALPPAHPISASQLKGDLDNIILKALRKEPSERYGSVQQFSEDISRFLQGLPVLARPQTLKYRFGKYVTRHKAGALAAALILSSLVGGISVAIWQAQIARHEREKAEQNFNDVRSLSRAVIFDLHKAIQDLPGSTAARELLVKKSLEYLDKLALADQSDTSLQMEVAEGYDQIATIQGGHSANHLGQRENALANYLKALAIKEKLAAAEPQNVKFRQQLGASYFNVGNMYYVQSDMPGSLKMYQKSVGIFEEILRENPEDSSIKYSLAKALNQKGVISVLAGEIEEGFQNIESSLKLSEELANENPDMDNLHSLVSILNRYGDFLSDIKKDYQEALKNYQRAFEISRQLAEKDPHNTVYQRAIAISYFRFGQFYFDKEEYQPALTNTRQALEIAAKLQNQDSQNEEVKTLVAQLERWVSKILIMMGKASEAVPSLNNSLKILERRYADSPTDKGIYFEIGEINLQLGYAYKSLDRKKSCEHFQKTFNMYQEFLGFGYSDAGAFNEQEINQLKEEVKQCSK